MNDGLIIERDSKSKDTIYYLSGCILSILKKDHFSVEALFEEIHKEFNDSIDFTKFLLSLDFLYLLNKIEVSERGLIRCISKG